MLHTEEGPSTYRWWLRLQLAFVVVGGLAWVVGAVLERPFVTGTGLGLFLAALGLRLGRRAAEDSPHRAREASGEEGA